MTFLLEKQIPIWPDRYYTLQFFKPTGIICAPGWPSKLSIWLLISAQVTISRFVISSSCLGFSLSLSLSLCSSPQKINKLFFLRERKRIRKYLSKAFTLLDTGIITPCCYSYIHRISLASGFRSLEDSYLQLPTSDALSRCHSAFQTNSPLQRPCVVAMRVAWSVSLHQLFEKEQKEEIFKSGSQDKEKKKKNSIHTWEIALGFADNTENLYLVPFPPLPLGKGEGSCPKLEKLLSIQ